MNRGVRVGGPILLIIVGLVLSLAVGDQVDGINLTMIGWIVAGAGVLWLAIELITNRPRSTVSEERTNVDGHVTERQRRTDEV